eukprot:355803-Chlamydomonas_euryale.AAC.8
MRGVVPPHIPAYRARRGACGAAHRRATHARHARFARDPHPASEREERLRRRRRRRRVRRRRALHAALRQPDLQRVSVVGTRRAQHAQQQRSVDRERDEVAVLALALVLVRVKQDALPKGKGVMEGGREGGGWFSGKQGRT